MKKISYEGWKKAFDKWTLIAEKILAGEKFSNYRGFKDLPVIEKCSYCKESGSCLECHLGNFFIDGKRVCWTFENKNTLLFSIWSGMREKNPNFKETFGKVLIFKQAVAENRPEAGAKTITTPSDAWSQQRISGFGS